MELKIDKIILTREVREQQDFPVEDDNTDVIVKMENGDLFIASFFAYAWIEKYKKKHAKNVYFLNGKYFWAKGMLLIENCDKNTIKAVVQHLIEGGDFIYVFKSI